MSYPVAGRVSNSTALSLIEKVAQQKTWSATQAFRANLMIAIWEFLQSEAPENLANMNPDELWLYLSGEGQ